MLTSLALLFLLGLALGGLCTRIHLPPLLGMIAAGLILGPYVFDAIDQTVLNISTPLRQFALVVILLRAGLALDLAALRRVGRPAVLLCFVPASFEILGCIVLAPPLLGVTYIEAAILGSVLAAVSPAVVVPRMLALMERGAGTEHSIPQMIMAGSSVDDVFVIVMLTVTTGIAAGGSFSPLTLLQVPVSIVLGLIAGLIVGVLFAKLFRLLHVRDSAKVLVLLRYNFFPFI